jgi:hypothetical protein
LTAFVSVRWVIRGDKVLAGNLLIRELALANAGGQPRANVALAVGQELVKPFDVTTMVWKP